MRAGLEASCSTRASYEFQPPQRESEHPQQQPSVRPALDIGLPVSPFVIAHRHVDDLEVELGRTKYQIEVAERIEIAEVGSVGGDRIVVGPAQNLGAAQRILDVLAEQPGEGQAEKLVAEEVQKRTPFMNSPRPERSAL
jgi:hypothetical protein